VGIEVGAEVTELTDIENMPAGRQMDALVGEKVMQLEVLGMSKVQPDYDGGGYGVVFDRDLPDHYPVRPIYVSDCCCEELRQPGDIDYWGHYAGCLDVVAHYSTDIAAAWEVAHHIGRQRFSVRYRFIEAIEELLPTVMPEEMRASCYQMDRLWALLFYADLCPLICRAALKAVETEEDSSVDIR